MSTAQTTDVATRFLDAFACRDFGAVATALAEDARLREAE